MAKRNPTRLVFVVSDLHCGSTVGLCPPDFELAEGTGVRLNLFQQWLWQCWTDMRDNWLPSIVGDDPWAMVVNGDALDGNHHRTKQIISPDEGDHLACAMHCLAPFAELAETVAVVKGTECHTGTMESALGLNLGGIRDPTTKQHAFDRLLMDVHGTRCVFRHHIGTTARPYLEASQHSIHLGAERVEAARAGHPVPQVLCCGHRHRVGSFTDGMGLTVITGAWQGLTRFGHKVVSPAVPVPAVAVLDWRNAEAGALPQVHWKQYIPAAPEAVTI